MAFDIFAGLILLRGCLAAAWPSLALAAPKLQPDVEYAATAGRQGAAARSVSARQPPARRSSCWVHGGAWENGDKSAMPLSAARRARFRRREPRLQPGLEGAVSRARSTRSRRRFASCARGEAIRLRRRPHRHRRRLLGRASRGRRRHEQRPRRARRHARRPPRRILRSPRDRVVFRSRRISRRSWRNRRRSASASASRR